MYGMLFVALFANGVLLATGADPGFSSWFIHLDGDGLGYFSWDGTLTQKWLQYKASVHALIHNSNFAKNDFTCGDIWS